jgi:hypothetical protein
MIATLVAPSISSWMNGRPLTTAQSRASKYSTVTPWITVPQLRLPNTTCAVPRVDGAATWTAPTSRWIAYASSSVMVCWLPVPTRIPLDVTLPDSTTIRFEPRL